MILIRNRICIGVDALPVCPVLDLTCKIVPVRVTPDATDNHSQLPDTAPYLGMILALAETRPGGVTYMPQLYLLNSYLCLNSATFPGHHWDAQGLPFVGMKTAGHVLCHCWWDALKRPERAGRDIAL